VDIVQNFYDSPATDYDKLFYDWSSSVKEQAAMLDSLFASYGFDRSAKILDCACGIGTQAIGPLKLGYRVSASDISERELEEAAKRAQGISGISFMRADFRELSSVFRERFDIVMAMDNALPHMLTENNTHLRVGRSKKERKYVYDIR